jgi:hypothetical protein
MENKENWSNTRACPGVGIGGERRLSESFMIHKNALTQRAAYVQRGSEYLTLKSLHSYTGPSLR